MRNNLARLTSGAVLGQAIIVGSIPFLTRLFPPEAFGAFAVFTAVYAFLVPMTTLKYDASVVLTGSERVATVLTMFVVFLASSLCLLVSIIISTNLLSPIWQKLDNLTWLPLALWLGAMYTLFQQWAARASDYRYYSRSQVISAAANVSVSLSGGYLVGGSVGLLVAGFIVGLTTGIVYLLFNQQPRRHHFKCIRVNNFRRLAIAYAYIPKLVLPTILINVMGTSLLPVVLVTSYDLHETGSFAIANRLLLVPAAVFGTAVSETFRAEFMHLIRSRQATGAVLGVTFKRLLAVALPLFGLLFLLAPWAVPTVFGQTYGSSGDIVRALTLGNLAQFVCNPFGHVFIAFRQSGKGLAAQALQTVLPIVSLAVAAHYGASIVDALAVYSFVTLIVVVGVLRMIFNLTQTNDKRYQAGGGL